MEVGKDFKDIKSYTKSMGNVVEDKLFFLDKLNLENFIFIDFGCANGTVLRALEKIYPCNDQHFRGYLGFDISDTMIDMARKEWDGSYDTVYFSSNWDELIRVYDRMKRGLLSNGTTILFLSSVLHEVYSYGTPEDIETFWQRVSKLGADYVVFRDMMWSTAYDKMHTKTAVDSIRASDSCPGLWSFEQRWGGIDVPKNLVHYLLKYRWQINWERENAENYFPISLSEFLEHMSPEYDPQYLNHAPVPFIQQKIREDWDLELRVPTHLKAIFRRK